MSPSKAHLTLLLAISFHTSYGVGEENGSNEDGLQYLRSHPDCVCYTKVNSFTCHCERVVHIHVQGCSAVDLQVDMFCDDENLPSDPYQHLSLLDAEYLSNAYFFIASFRELVLNVSGCPPPEYPYSMIPVRREGSPSVIRKVAPGMRLIVDCGNSKSFGLNNRHFEGLDNLNSLFVDCRALSQVDFLSSLPRDMSSLKITNSELEVVPAGALRRHNGLVSLNLEGNRLRSIGSLKGLEKLTFFVLSANRIEELDDDVFQHSKRIGWLKIDHNLLSRLPDSLCGLRNLEKLHAENNRIEFLRAGCFVEMPLLNALFLSGNKLRNLDPYPILGNGAISSNGIEGIPDDATDPKTTAAPLVAGNSSACGAFPHMGDSLFSCGGQLTTLSFANNHLASIPENLFKTLFNLTSVDLSFNRLSSIPPKLFQDNIRLHNLILSNNLLSNISEDLLSKNSDLRLLDLSNNKIQTLGSGFLWGLPNLRDINLSNNSIVTLPYNMFLFNIGRWGMSRDSKGHLDLEGNRLTSLPILTLPWLTHLNLARNRLSHLPNDTLVHVPSLVKIDLSHNQFQSLFRGSRNDTIFPSSLGKLSLIDLSHNRLDHFPVVEQVMQSLKALNLSGNRIGNFPKIPFLKINSETYRFQRQFSSLETLDLSNNTLGRTFMDNIRSELNPQKMSSNCYWNEDERMHEDIWKTKHLDLSRNGLTLSQSLVCDPPAPKRCHWFLKQFLRLEVLLLAHNKFHFVPVSFRSLPKLRLVDLSYNEIKAIAYDDFFAVNGVSLEMMRVLGDSENDYVKKGDTYESLYYRHLTADLRNNQISFLELPEEKMQTVPKDCEVDRQFSRATMLLGNNPIVCSCQVLKLLRYAQKEVRPVSEGEKWRGERKVLPVTLDIGDLSCREPLSMRGKKVSDPEDWIHHLIPLLGLCHSTESR